MAKRKPTVNQLEYKKQIARLRRIVTKLEKSGAVFIDSPIPQQPSRVTKKAIKSVTSLTTADIKSKGYKLDYETGELTSIEVSEKEKTRARKRRERYINSGKTSKPKLPKPQPHEPIFTESVIPEPPLPEPPQPKPQQSPPDADYPLQEDVIIDNIKAELSASNNKVTAELLLNALQSQIDDLGEQGLVSKILNLDEMAIELANKVRYDSDNPTLRNDAYALAWMIYGGDFPAFFEADIEQAANEDIPAYRRK